MSKETKVNNQKGAPNGQVPEANQETVVDSEPSFEELRKTAIRMTEEHKQNVTPTIEEPEETEEITEETSETEETEDQTEELPDEFKGKSPEEIAKMYINLRKMQAKQQSELGELRKLREKQEELKKETEKYSVNAASQELINNTIDNMSKEEADKWLDELSENPKKALAPMILEIVGPLVKRVAKTNNESVEQDLIKRTENSLVPYKKYQDEINEVLNQKDKDGRRYLFDRFGSKAFEEAYRVVYDRHFEENRQKLEEEARKAREEAPSPKPKKNTFVQQQTNASVNRGSDIDADNMDFPTLRQKIIEMSAARK
jgi:hypothetical protein